MIRRATTALLVATFVVVGWPTTAIAGTFDVTSCLHSPTGSANNAWVPSATDATVHTSSTCSAGMTADPAPVVETLVGLSAGSTWGVTTTNGAEARWRLTAPAGTAITRIRYHRYSGRWSTTYHMPFLRSAEGTILDADCAILPTEAGGNDYWCHSGAASPNGGSAYADVATNTSSLDFGIGCNGACPSTASNYRTWASMYGSTVTITESTPPVLNASSTGAWGDPGWLAGNQTVTVASSTDTTGIKRLRLLVDGAPAQTVTPACNYTYVVPCANQSNVAMALDTTQLADGQRTLTLESTDAANNTTTATKTVRLDNTPPTAPSLLTPSVATTDGQATVRWAQVSAGAGSPITKVRWQLCDQHGGACGQASDLAADATQASLTSLADGSHTVRVWAVDEAGHVGAVSTAQVTQSTPAPPATPDPPATNPPPSTPPSGGTVVAPTPTNVTVTQTPTDQQRPATRPGQESTSREPGSTTKKQQTLEDPELRLLSARRRGRHIVLKGKADDYLDTMKVTVTVRQGKRSRRYRRTTNAARWTVRVPAPRGRGRVVVTVSIAKGDGYRAASATRRVTP